MIKDYEKELGVRIKDSRFDEDGYEIVGEESVKTFSADNGETWEEIPTTRENLDNLLVDIGHWLDREMAPDEIDWLEANLL